MLWDRLTVHTKAPLTYDGLGSLIHCKVMLHFASPNFKTTITLYLKLADSQKSEDPRPKLFLNSPTMV